MTIKKTNLNIKAIFNYLQSDFIKKKRSFTIGLTTVFLVVFFICLLMNTLSLAPAIFLRLSEDQAGEIDIIMLPYFNQQDASKLPSAFDRIYKNKNEEKSASNFLQFLNFTDMNSKLANNKEIQGITPRWVVSGNVTNQNNSWALSNILIINSRLENKYGLGRKLNLQELNSFVIFFNYRNAILVILFLKI
jgi:hypothetical protein